MVLRANADTVRRYGHVDVLFGFFAAPKSNAFAVQSVRTLTDIAFAPAAPQVWEETGVQVSQLRAGINH